MALPICILSLSHVPFIYKDVFLTTSKQTQTTAVLLKWEVISCSYKHLDISNPEHIWRLQGIRGQALALSTWLLCIPRLNSKAVAFAPRGLSGLLPGPLFLQQDGACLQVNTMFNLHAT